MARTNHTRFRGSIFNPPSKNPNHEITQTFTNKKHIEDRVMFTSGLLVCNLGPQPRPLF
jgi:hypothetical protein